MMERVSIGYFYREHSTDVSQCCEEWEEDMLNMASEQRTELGSCFERTVQLDCDRVRPLQRQGMIENRSTC